MKIQSLTLNYPPRRFIGSELMTHTMNRALTVRHEVRATTQTAKHNPGFEGVPVAPFRWSDPDWADAFVCHADYAGPVVGLGKPVVAICHNTEEGVRLSLRRNRFDLVVANSDTMRRELEARFDHPIITVRPPAKPVGEVSSGDAVTIVNINRNKVGRFWDIVEARPAQKFIVVLGGYGKQEIPAVVPPNVQIVEHVPAGSMFEKVWSRTRLLLAPSIRESWNMTAGEAITHGIPVVATDLPGVRENLGDAATYLDVNDLDAWVRAIDAPVGDTLMRAQMNHLRHLEDIAKYVEAVTRLGDDHAQAA